MRLMSDEPEQAAALMEVYVAANPRNADGQFTLAMAYEGIAFNIKLTGDPASPARIAQLEKAADRYRSYLALVRDVNDGSYRAAGLKSLARIYGREALNRPADAERAARQLLDEDRNSSESYLVLAKVLREVDRHGEATELLRKARFSLPASEQRPLAAGMWLHALASPKLPRAEIQALVDDLSAIAEGWLANDPGNPTGPIAKRMAVELCANRLEQDPVRKRALLAEADLWRKVSDARTAPELADVMEKLKELRARSAAR
jgi:tetratricopeptide (TPR) repeat protein